MHVEDTVRYEVWTEAGDKMRRTRDAVLGFLTFEAANELAAEYQAEEIDNARRERRPVAKHFVVVKATTTREVLRHGKA